MHIPTSIQTEMRGRDLYIFDPIRQKWILQTPEEIVRQRFILFLVHKRGVPPSLISVEKDLKTLPHLTQLDPHSLPQRRLDILVYHPKQKSLYPLLMVECKAVSLTRHTEEQVLGYNHYVQAKYVAIVNESQLLTANTSEETVQFDPYLPHFEELIK